MGHTAQQGPEGLSFRPLLFSDATGMGGTESPVVKTMTRSCA